MSLSLNIEVNLGAQPIGRYTFSSGKNKLIKIGSVATAQITIQDPSANRLHAAIELSEDTAILKDLGTLNGTLVNGQRITRHKLADGDTITIGQTSLAVQLVAARVVEVVPAPVMEVAANVMAPAAMVASGWAPGRGPSPTLVSQMADLDGSAISDLRAFVGYLQKKKDPNLAAALPRPSRVMASFDTTRRSRIQSAMPAAEKHDTRWIVGQLKRDRRRTRATVAAVASLAVALVSVMASLSDRHGSQRRLAAAALLERSPVAQKLADELRQAPQSVAESARAMLDQVHGRVAIEERTYTVRPGDTLGRIAARLFGDERRSDALYAANRRVLASPERIEVGMVLTVPHKADEAEARLLNQP